MELVLFSIHIEESPRAVSLATAMLAAAVQKSLGSKVNSCLVDSTLQLDVQDDLTRILACQPQVVGFSIAVWNRHRALEIARCLKQAHPEIVLLAGGPEVTADPQSLRQTDLFEHVLPGEGELKIVAVLRSLLGENKDAADDSAVVNLAELPSPYLSGWLRPAPGAGALWELSRGCPYRCDFCFESRGSSVVRRFPLPRLRAELQHFAKLGLDEIFVLDPTFNYHQQTAKDMLRLMAREGRGLRFSLEIRAERIDREMAELFSRLNCSLQIGLQSAHSEVLRHVHRDFDPEEFSDKILLLHEAGVSYGFDLIYGLPGDSLDGFLASLDFALGLVPNHLDMFPLAVLPGTRLAETAGQLGLSFQDRPPYRVLSSTTFSVEDMNQAARVAAACDFFYNRGRAVPWFGMVLDSLALAASDFFCQLAAWLPHELPEQPLEWQKKFVRHLFMLQERPAEADLCDDLLNYFGQVEALFDHPPEIPPARQSGLTLNPAFRLVYFHHDPQQLTRHLAEGVTDLEELAFFLPRVDREYYCGIVHDSLQLCPLTVEQSDYLRTFSSGSPATPPAGFIDFALEAGILTDTVDRKHPKCL